MMLSFHHRMAELGIQAGSWQEKLTLFCNSGAALTVKPKAGSALVFYSQLQDGALDPTALHGGCPVLSSMDQPKWIGNLWFWNGNPGGEKDRWPREKMPSKGGAATGCDAELFLVNNLHDHGVAVFSRWKYQEQVWSSRCFALLLCTVLCKLRRASVSMICRQQIYEPE